MDKYILTKGHGFEWHVYVFIDEFGYNNSFD
jgi:hypothetical protein